MCKRIVAGAAVPLCLLLASACAGPQEAGSNQALTPSPAANASSLSGATASASPSPGIINVTLDISPNEVKIGDVVMTLALEAPRHLADQAMQFALTAATNIDPAQPVPTPVEGTSKGALVLSDMLKTSNNMDPTQAIPPDTVQAIVRHVVVQIRTADTGQPVPYLGVNLDILFDGKPTTFGQALVPMVQQEAQPPRMYYGNNLRLGQRGTYQVFVRMSRSALLGKDQPQAAQFNLTIR
jgi:hypothetical protein